MEKYVSVRIESLKKNDAVGQFKHDIRYKLPGYVKNPEWKYIIEPEEDFNKILNKIKDRYNKNNKRKIQKNGRYTISGILTFSENVTNQEIEKFDKYAKIAIEKIAEELNTDIIYLSRHDDETKKHYHFQLSYIDRDGKALRNKLTKKMMSKLQDIAGEVFEELGLTRGKTKEQRIKEAKLLGEDPNKIYKYRTVDELHRNWAKDKIKKEIRKIKEKYIKQGFLTEKFDSEGYIRELEKMLISAKLEILDLNNRLNIVSEKIIEEKMKNKRIDRLEWEIEQLKSKINNPKWLKKQLKSIISDKQKTGFLNDKQEEDFQHSFQNQNFEI